MNRPEHRNKQWKWRNGYRRNALGKKKLFKRHSHQLPIDQKIKRFRLPIRISWSRSATKLKFRKLKQSHISNTIHTNSNSNSKQISMLNAIVTPSLSVGGPQPVKRAMAALKLQAKVREL